MADRRKLLSDRTPEIVQADCERSEIAFIRALQEMEPEPCECCEPAAWLDWTGRLTELAERHRRRVH